MEPAPESSAQASTSRPIRRPSLSANSHPYSARCPSPPTRPKKPRDYARPTRAKASRPDAPPTEPALDRLLNPGIERGTAGMGSGTGLQPPPDNSFDRRADFSRRAPRPQVDAQELSRASRSGRSPATRAGPRAVAGARHQRRAAQGARLRQQRSVASRWPTRWPVEHDEISDISEPRREKRQMHRPSPQPVTLGVTASMQSLEQLLREGRAEFNTAQVWTPHRPPRPEKSEGGMRLVIKSDFEPKGDQPTAIKDLVEGVKRTRPHPGAARRHRLGQDLHHGEGDRGDAAPGAGAGAEQDAGRAALRRVQELLPRQRGRVFRLVLRLLPAGSLRPAHRHLHREGILDQRADRPHAALGDARAAGARRRDHRRLGVVHLRHRLGRDLFGDDLHAQAGRAHRPAPAARRPGGAAIQAHQRFRARHVPGARRHDRHLPGALRGPRLAGAPVRRRDRQDRRVRSAHRPEDRRPGVRQGLRQLALRHAAADADAGDRRHQGRAEAAARRAAPHRPPAGSAAAGAAHALRPRDDGGDRQLRRHRELFALSHRPQARRAAADAVRIRARQRADLRRREPRHRAAARRHVPRRLPPQGDARRIRLPPAVLHGQPAAALRGVGRDAAADRRRLGDARRRGR